MIAKPRKSIFDIVSGSPGETETLGEELAGLCSAGDVISLVGPLGAGKTCLVRGLARGLGINHQLVHSPTFTLVNEYLGRVALYHFDLYRLSKPEDLVEIGIYDYMEAGSGIAPGVVVVEWGDRVPLKFPESTFYVTMAYASDPSGQQRRVTVLGRDKRT